MWRLALLLIFLAGCEQPTPTWTWTHQLEDQPHEWTWTNREPLQRT
jgi:hypothetical protein